MFNHVSPRGDPIRSCFVETLFTSHCLAVQKTLLPLSVSIHVLKSRPQAPSVLSSPSTLGLFTSWYPAVKRITRNAISYILSTGFRICWFYPLQRGKVSPKMGILCMKRNHRTVYQLFVLDRNNWYHISSCEKP